MVFRVPGLIKAFDNEIRQELGLNDQSELVLDLEFIQLYTLLHHLPRRPRFVEDFFNVSLVSTTTWCVWK